SLKKPKKLLHKLDLAQIKAEHTTVILFTSGTESLPKGVPLSHGNILSNQRAALSCADINADDVMYSVLPPFHSFGFSATGLLPLLAGLRVCYAPDPTDGRGMAEDIHHWQATLFCCAPSFMRALFTASDPNLLQSVRLFVGGAEKVSEELFEEVAALGSGHELIEGYGITECSPIVTLNRQGHPKRGVGQPLPGIELIVIDPETEGTLALGQEGEVCIAGPSVFSGYLGGLSSPFITRLGRRWYRSGDRGYLESDGSLILTGRLKRFVKIGGEMISLGGLEEEILHLAKEKKWTSFPTEGPPLAVSAVEQEMGKPLIILFATFDISKDEVNFALKESGYGRLVKIAEVKRIEQIPLTGTGKTHYRLLDELYR
ncbi:MAG: AMP-binding protein, partial [Anaerolineae bacterium]